MATNLLPIQPALVIRASAVSNNTRRVKTSTANPTTVNGGGGGGGSSWWSPLFGWSSEPDYIDSSNKKEDHVKSGLRSESITDPEPKRVKSRFTPGCFTEEKAKQLRMMTSEAESFHDVMYHSAIASRLASDFSRRR